ncbi:MAG: TIGR03000 domain-containing protein, partial [Pirellulaceae bacterium]
GGVVSQGQVIQGGVYTTTPSMTTQPGNSLMQPSIQVQPGVQYSTPEQGQPVPGGRIQGGSTPPPSPNSTETLPETLPVSGDTAILNLRVPTDAVVYVNGKRTSTPGSFRSYVSRNLDPGKNYSYEVRAEVERSGETVARTKVVELAAGVNKTFELDFQQAEETITSVTLFVPEDAQVSLGGVETKASGPMRYFSTTSLKHGDQWKAYQVSVTVERDGEQITRKRYVDVNAGESVNLRFDFDTAEQVASR